MTEERTLFNSEFERFEEFPEIGKGGSRIPSRIMYTLNKGILKSGYFVRTQ